MIKKNKGVKLYDKPTKANRLTIPHNAYVTIKNSKKSNVSLALKYGVHVNTIARIKKGLITAPAKKPNNVVAFKKPEVVVPVAAGDQETITVEVSYAVLQHLSVLCGGSNQPEFVNINCIQQNLVIVFVAKKKRPFLTRMF